MVQEMISSYKAMFINYANFKGRTNKRNFWLAVLANVIVSFVVGLVTVLIGLPVIGMIYMFAILIPSLALEIRRLHDIGKSEWYILLALIPLIGTLVLIYFYCQPSVTNDKYGAEV